MSFKYIIFDRDGTLIKHKPYMYKPEMVELFPDTIDSLKILKNNDFQFFLHTNQSGVGRGMFSLKDAQKCNDKMIQLIGLGDDIFNKICIAPEYPAIKDGYRKPSVKFGNEIIKEYDVKIQNLIYVGDSIVDIQTGNNLGCRTYGLNTGLFDISKNTNTLDFKCFKNLSTFTNYLITNG